VNIYAEFPAIPFYVLNCGGGPFKHFCIEIFAGRTEIGLKKTEAFNVLIVSIPFKHELKHMFVIGA
jgi:hypothetical protein